MTKEFSDGEGIQALYYNLEVKREMGWAVFEPGAGNCQVETADGNLGTGQDTLTINSGSVLLGGSVVTIPEQTFSVPEGSNEPRKDVIIVNPQGDVARISGYPEPAHPDNAPLAQSERPAPSALTNADSVPLAMLAIGSNATGITNSNIVDLRRRAEMDVSHLNANSASIDGDMTVGGTVDANEVTGLSGYADQDELDSHTSDTDNPHQVTSEDIGAFPVGSTDLENAVAVNSPFQYRSTAYGNFGTDTTFSESGQDMHYLLRGRYRDRSTDSASLGGIKLINYNTTGGGWYADRERYRHGLRLLAMDGAGNEVPGLTIDDNGDSILHGDSDVLGNLTENGDRVATRTWANSNVSGSDFSGSHTDLTDISADDHHDPAQKADNPHDNAAHSETYAVDGDSQPPESHDNGSHSEPFISDGDGVERQIWVIEPGASDPAGASDNDLIFEREG